jgi:hypothetical protein
LSQLERRDWERKRSEIVAVRAVCAKGREGRRRVVKEVVK